MKTIQHKFVGSIPESLEPDILYISMEYGTAVHLCQCGCGNEVVTPFSPTDWKITFDGESVSLDPSIGNWNFPCQSHYWIDHNKVKMSKGWSRHEIEQGRSRDKKRKNRFYSKKSRTGSKKKGKE